MSGLQVIIWRMISMQWFGWVLVFQPGCFYVIMDVLEGL